VNQPRIGARRLARSEPGLITGSLHLMTEFKEPLRQVMHQVWIMRHGPPEVFLRARQN
jgi:hypothetical protein